MKRVLIFSLVLLSTLAGCRSNTSSISSISRVDSEPVFFSEFSQMQQFSDPLKILSADVRGNRLHILVSFRGGCAQHHFSLFVWSGFSKSMPPQAMLYLSHEAGGDHCESKLEEELVFDLLPLHDRFLANYSGNRLLLRIYAPNATDPFHPLPVYNF